MFAHQRKPADVDGNRGDLDCTIRLILMYWLMEWSQEGPPKISRDTAGSGFSALRGQVPTEKPRPQIQVAEPADIFYGTGRGQGDVARPDFPLNRHIDVKSSQVNLFINREVHRTEGFFLGVAQPELSSLRTRLIRTED